MFIGLLLRAMKSDVNLKRISAFSKRLLQVGFILPCFAVFLDDRDLDIENCCFYISTFLVLINSRMFASTYIFTFQLLFPKFPKFFNFFLFVSLTFHFSKKRKLFPEFWKL